MREDLDVKSSFEEEDTIPHLHLPNMEMHYADLKITDNRKRLYERKTRLAVSQGLYTEYRRTLDRKNPSKVM